MIWFNNTQIEKLNSFVTILEGEMEHRGEKNLRVFIIYMNPAYSINNTKGPKTLQGKLKKWCNEQNLKRVAFLWVPSPTDEENCGVFKINPRAENTVFVYKKRKIADKWVNIDYSEESLKSILRNFD